MRLFNKNPLSIPVGDEVYGRIFSISEVPGKTITQAFGIVQLTVDNFSVHQGSTNLPDYMKWLLEAAIKRGGNAVVNYRMLSTPYSSMGNIQYASLVLYGDAVTLE